MTTMTTSSWPFRSYKSSWVSGGRTAPTRYERVHLYLISHAAILHETRFLTVTLRKDGGEVVRLTTKSGKRKYFLLDSHNELFFTARRDLDA